MKVKKESRPCVCRICHRAIPYKKGITAYLMFDKKDTLLSTTGCCPICILKWAITSLGFTDEDTTRLLGKVVEQ